MSFSTKITDKAELAKPSWFADYQIETWCVDHREERAKASKRRALIIGFLCGAILGGVMQCQPASAKSADLTCSAAMVTVSPAHHLSKPHVVAYAFTYDDWADKFTRDDDATWYDVSAHRGAVIELVHTATHLMTINRETGAFQDTVAAHDGLSGWVAIGKCRTSDFHHNAF